MLHKNIYLITGDSDFLIEERIEELKKLILKDTANLLNYEKINGTDISLEEFILALRTPPMFSDKKLFYIKDFYILKEAINGLSVIEKNIISELKNLLPNNFVIFSNMGRLDIKNDFIKELTKFVQQEEYNNYSVWDEDGIVSWIMNNIRNKGYELDEESALILKDSTNGDLRMINMEISKIITYLGNSKRDITKDDVLLVISSNGVNAFKLMNVIREWKTKEASYLIFEMLSKGEEPVRLLYYIVSQLRFLLLLKIMSGKSLEEITQYMGKFNMSKNMYYLKRCLNYTDKLSFKTLKVSFDLAQKTDFFIKTGKMEPRIALENFTNRVFVGS